MNDGDRAFSRPAARIDDRGGLEVRASAAMGCRRALWYAATGHGATNEPTDESVTVMEAGKSARTGGPARPCRGLAGRSLPTIRQIPREYL